MSKFSIGDKVRFLNEVGGGVITRIIDKEMVLVKNDDDWEIPVLMSELIHDTGGFFGFDAKSTQPKNESAASKIPEMKPSQNRDKSEIQAEKQSKNKTFDPKEKMPSAKMMEGQYFLGFIPSDEKKPVDSDVEAYFINDSPYHLLFHYSILFQDKSISREAGILEPDTKLFLERYKRIDLPSVQKVHLQWIQYSPQSEFTPMPPKEFTLDIAGVKFFKAGSFVENDFFYEPAIIYPLKNKPEASPEGASGKLVVKEEDKPRVRSARKSGESSTALFETVEVDLHIEQLAPNFEHLNNLEILGIQMDKFHLEMGKAIRDGSRRVVFIHGVGNGVLKQELAKELKHKYKHFQFQDASFREYGYGATLVMLRK